MLLTAALLLCGNVVAAEASSPGYQKIEGNQSHTVAIGKDRTVWAWGKNYQYQLGDGTTEQAPSIKQVAGLSGIVDVKVGSSFTVALNELGDVYVWGTISTYSTLIQYTTPTKLSGLPSITAISASNTAVFALGENGKVYTLGYGIDGELGQNGTINESVTPVTVKLSSNEDLSGITQIAAGQYHVMALSGSGTVYTWGMNMNGQLGTNSTGSIGYANPILQGISWIAAGSTSSSSFAYGEGHLYGWGSNYFGKLGTGNEQHQLSPAEVTLPAGKTPVQVALGNLHTIVRMSDGTVYGAGSNARKELGSSYQSTNVTLTPLVQDMTNIVSVSATASRTYVISADGNAWGWGENTWNGPSYEYWYGLINPNLYSYREFESPTQLIPLKTYTNADLGPKPLQHVQIEKYDYTRFKIKYTIPPLSQIDGVHIKIYDKDDLTKPLHTYDGYGFLFSETNSHTTDNGFFPGKSYVITLQPYGADIDGSVETYNNGGEGYNIPEGESSLTVQANIWNIPSVLPASNANVELKRKGTSTPVEKVTDGFGRVQYDKLYNGNYELIIYDVDASFVEYQTDIYIDGSASHTVTLIPFGQPYDLTFNDEDTSSGAIAGTLYWKKSDHFVAQTYKIYFENDNGTKIGGPIGEATAEEGTTNYYYDLPEGTLIPSGATRIRLYLIEPEVFTETATPAYVTLWDKPVSLPHLFSMGDLNVQPGQVQPVFTWNKSDDENSFANYVIFFKSFSESPYAVPNVVARVAKNGGPSYQITLPGVETARPDNPYELGLEKGDGTIAPLSIPAMYWDSNNQSTGPAYTVGEVPTPSEVTFNDTDTDAYEIGGPLSWNGTDWIEEYSLFFLDENGSPVQSIANVYPSDYSNPLNVIIPKNTAVPAGAKKIGIYALKSWAEERSLAGTVDLILPDSDNELTSLSLNNGGTGSSLTYGNLNGNVQIIDVKVGSTATGTTITGLFPVNAKISVTGAVYQATNSHLTITVPNETGSIEVRVTAQDGSTMVYQFNVIREQSDLRLSEIKINDGGEGSYIEQGTLSGNQIPYKVYLNPLSSANPSITATVSQAVYVTVTGATYNNDVGNILRITGFRAGEIITANLSANGQEKIYEFTIANITPSQQVSIHSSIRYIDLQAMEITLSASVSGSKIYYTLDGSNPTSDSILYTPDRKPTVGPGQTLKAIAKKEGMLDSSIFTITGKERENIGALLKRLSGHAITKQEALDILKLIQPIVIGASTE